MKAYLAQRKEKASDLLEFHHAKYEEWMQYFGFSMERELQWYKDEKQRANSRGKTRKAATHSPTTNTTSPGASSRPNTLTPEGGTSIPFANLHKSPTPMFSSPTPPPMSGIPDCDSSVAASPTKGILKTNSNSRLTSPDKSTASKRDAEDPIQAQNIPDTAKHGLEILSHFSSKLEDADARATAVGPLVGKSLAEIVAAVTEPYKKVTWRQDSCAVALMRTRSLYCWMCKNLKVEMPTSSDAGGRGRDGGVRFADASGPPVLPATPQKGAMKKAAAAAPQPLPPSDDPSAIHLPTIKAKKGGPKAESVDSQCQSVLDLRKGDPRKLATLFSEMLQLAGVESTNVKGSLKGVLDSKGKPSGFISKWGWNMVSIPYPSNASELFPYSDLPFAANDAEKVSALDTLTKINIKNADLTVHLQRAASSSNSHRPKMSLLIDVSLSLAHVGPRIINNPSIDKKPDAASNSVTSAPVSPRDGKGQSKSSGQKSNTQQGSAASPGSTVETEEQLVEKRQQLLKAAQAKSWEAQHEHYSATNPAFTHHFDLSTHYEPFYFGCDPRMFVSLHYPEDAQKDALLLERPVSKPMWESYPRLDHSFYKYGLLLDSHRRKSQLIVKSAPFYVSFLLQDPAHVEMSATIFQGTLSQLPSSDWNKQPTSRKLGPGFVYSMREERTHRQTFTLMTPDVGQYTVVFGARFVHRDPTSPDVSNDPFDVVAVYNVNVSFVALNEPILPHQHLTPATVKLVEPSSHKILLGPQRFTVVPTSSRVISVAIVNFLEKERDDKLLVSTSRPHSRAVSSNIQTPKPLPALPPLSTEPPTRKMSVVNKKGRVSTPAESVLSSDFAPPPPKTTQELKEEAREKFLRSANVTVLELNPETACFSGDVKVEQGVCEVWVLVGDPTVIASGPPKPTPSTVAAAESAAQKADAAEQRLKSAEKPSTSKGSKASKGGKASKVEESTSVVEVHELPSDEPIEIANGSGGRIRGMFVPAITNLQAVRRILPKEATLNDGKEVIQPVLLEKKRLYGDLPFVFRLLSSGEVIGAPAMAQRRKRRPSANPYTQLEREKERIEAQLVLDHSIRVGGAPLIEMRCMQNPSARAKIKTLSEAEKLVLKPLKPVGEYFSA